MEISPELINGVKIALPIIAFSILALNRIYIRPHIKSKKYQDLSLHLDHIIGHIGETMLFDGIGTALFNKHIFPTNPGLFWAGTASVLNGIRSEVISPILKHEPIQLTQLRANFIGTFSYCFSAAILHI